MFDVLGSVLGGIFGSGDRDKAENEYQAAKDVITKIGTPAYQRIQAQQLGGMDPQTREILMRALDKYGQVSNEGFTPTDRAALELSQRQIADANRGNQEAILQRAAGQGGLGSANQLMAALSSQQGQADRVNQAGSNIAIAGRQRALDAIGQQAGLAGQIQQRNDAIARFNAAAKTNADAYNSQLGRAEFGDNLGLAQSKAGAYQNLGSHYDGKADATQAMWTGIGKGADQIVSTILNPMAGGASIGAGAIQPTPQRPTSDGGYMISRGRAGMPDFGYGNWG